MRGAVVGLLAVCVVAGFSAVGCSHKSKKRKKEPLQITTTSLDDATEGVAYSFAVQARGGNAGNYTWSVSGQPSWLSIDSTTGELSGTPPAGSAGTYTFTLTVTDAQQTVTKQFDLVVNTPPVVLMADFEANPTQGTAPLTVTFTDKSTGNPTSWQWDFDNDGIVDSPLQKPTHTYNSPGRYTVKLTVTGPGGADSCVREKYIVVVSNTWYVNGQGGNDGNSGTSWNDAWKTIGKALSVAGDYDLVLVADATYNETNLNFDGKKIYLKGVDHNTAGARPVIDCQGKGRAFHFASGETEDSVVDNFTIRNGKAGRGGAIYCEHSSSPTIRGCGISGSKADCGGGVCCDGSSNPIIINCRFSGNSAYQQHGGAIYCSSSSPTITGCTFSGNTAHLDGGAIYCLSNSSSITNCVFYDNSATGSQYNYGGAILCNRSTVCITGCTFSNNSADYGGAIACTSSTSTLSNCILWGDSAGTSGNEICIAEPRSACTLNYCCVDNTGYGGHSGKITENNCVYDDPRFVDPANGDYHLKDTSPCIDAGANGSVPSNLNKDIDGNPRIVDGDNNGSKVVDIGAYEYQP